MSQDNEILKSTEEIWVVPGFHSDVVWIEDQRDYAIVLIGDADQNIQICKADPDYGFFVHELTYLKPYYDTFPENRQFLRELIRDGRVGTGGSHSQPSETLIGPEGIVRNIIYGRLFHEGVLGDKPVIYMPWDVFGHTAQLGQILRKSRFIGCIWSKDIRGVQPVFWHVSLDGSKLLFKRMEYGVVGAGIEEEFIQLFEERSQEIASLGLTSDVRIDAGDFKPPSAWLVGRCAELKRRKPRFIVSGTGHEEWFRKAIDEIEEKRLNIPVTARDFEYHHQGTGVSRIEFKLSNRMAENTLLNAEKFATIANYLGAVYPDKALDKAWRQVLFNQHHDAMTGPLCDRSYLDLMLGYREALELGHEVLANSLDYIGSHIDTAMSNAGKIPFAVFNPLNWKRNDVCQVALEFEDGVENFEIVDHAGNSVSFDVLNLKKGENGKITSASVVILAEDVPSVGYKLFYAVPTTGCPMGPIETDISDGNIIENEYFRITVDPALGGGITSIYDKEAQRELISQKHGVNDKDGAKAPGNEIVALSEDPYRREPAWEVFTTGGKVFSRDYPAKVRRCTGRLISKLIISGDMKDCGRCQEIILYKGIRRIEFSTRLERYSGVHDLYVVTFPTTLQGLEPVFEERFGATVKRKSKGYLDFRTLKWQNLSECGVRRCYQWFGLGQSGMVECGTEGEDGYISVAIGMVGLVTGHDPEVLQSAYKLQEALVKRGIPVTPFFDDLDLERRLQLPSQDSRMPMADLNEDLPWGTSFRTALDVGGDNSYFRDIFDTIPEDKKEYYQQQLKTRGFACLLALDRAMPEGWPPLPVLLIGANSPEALRTCIDGIAAEISHGVVRLPALANATGQAAKPDDYGMLLLNGGNVLGSVEFDNTLVFFLMHTTAWAATPWGKDRLPYMFIPERKTHQFFYALYPHQGDWRSAHAFRAGYEYNNPLLARQLEPHEGALGPKTSFVEIEGDTLVMTAMKPAGFGVAALSDKKLDSMQGIIVRAYEATGTEVRGRIRFFKPLAAARKTNLLEENEGDVALCDSNSFDARFGPFGIETFCMIPTLHHYSSIKGTKLGREKESIQPVYFRYWQHNSGADPLGYCPVGVTLRGNVKTGVHIRQGGVSVNTIQVAIVNDYVDRRVKGEVQIIAPEMWKPYPDIVEYNLEPGGHLIKDVVIAFITDRKFSYRPQPAKGIIKARLVHDGQVIEDILEVGGESLVDWYAKLDESAREIIVTVSNSNQDEISGEVSMVSPMELWPDDIVGRISLGGVLPMRQGFTLRGNSSTELRFKLDIPALAGSKLPGAAWVIAKLAYHGKVDYKPVFGNAITESE